MSALHQWYLSYRAIEGSSDAPDDGATAPDPDEATGPQETGAGER